MATIGLALSLIGAICLVLTGAVLLIAVWSVVNGPLELGEVLMQWLTYTFVLGTTGIVSTILGGAAVERGRR